MRKLKKKLKENSPMEHSDVVCNCHKIDRFTPLINLFRDGFAFIRRGNADRLSYGIKLHKAMIHFYQDFVPHMHEEENVTLTNEDISYFVAFFFVVGYSTITLEIFY